MIARGALLAATLLTLLASRAEAQQTGTVVQLPTFSFFSVATTVSVPDRGGMYLGGACGAQSGCNRFGGPILPGQGGFGGGRGAGGFRVTAEIHDLRAQDLALLNRGSKAAAQPPGDLGRKLMAAQPNQALASVQELRRQATAAEQAEQAEAIACFARGRQAEEAGKLSVARIHYQMALRRADAALRQQIQNRLDGIRQPAIGR